MNFDSFNPHIYGIRSMRKLAEICCTSATRLEFIADHAGRYYKPFDIGKDFERNKWRHIDNPVGELRAIQRKLYKTHFRHMEFPNTVIGGVPKKSIEDNVVPHLASPLLVKIDIKNCFPSTSNKQVYQTFREVLDCIPAVAHVLTKLTTFQRRLPQGASTSVALSNIVHLEMFSKIHEICQEYELFSTFFVDDIGISGQSARQAIQPIISTIQRYGLAVRYDKIECLPAHKRQLLTGLTVNRKLSVGRKNLSKIRLLIHELSNNPRLTITEVRSLEGQIAHVSSICPAQGENLRRAAKSLIAKRLLDTDGKLLRVTRPCSSYRRHRND